RIFANPTRFAFSWGSSPRLLVCPTVPVSVRSFPQAKGIPMSEQQQATEVIVDDSATTPTYVNFCRVTATPEELILDFGLNPQPLAQGKQEVKASQRIVMNFFTAKRLLTALGMTVQRHEGTFGTIELDVNRRVSKPGGLPPFPPAESGSYPEVI